MKPTKETTNFSIKADIKVQSVDISHKAMLIIINKRFKDAKTPQLLYEYTRGVWKVGPKRDEAEYIFAVYKGIVRNVYKPAGPWVPAKTTEYKERDFGDRNVEGRWEFEGVVAEKEIIDQYVGKSVKQYIPHGAQNPIRYVNIQDENGSVKGGGRSKLRDWQNMNILVPIKDRLHERVFRKLEINPEESYLMDVKKAIFKKYGRKAIMTVNNPRKTLAEQTPDNAYGIAITPDERDFFMEKFGFTLEDYSSDISHRIIQDILSSPE